MAGNELERAVLEAARSWAHGGQQHIPPLLAAVEAYEQWLALQDPTIGERGWHEIVVGDEVQSMVTKRFYPVKHVQRVTGGKYELELVGVPKKITRPTGKEPTAIVRRGPDGQAADTLIHVFTSGGLT